MIISSNIQPQEWRLINMSMTELEQHYNKFNEENDLTQGMVRSNT